MLYRPIHLYMEKLSTFLLCHESLNYWPGKIFDYWLVLHHALVTRFPVEDTQALIDMHDNDALTVCLWKKTLCNNGENGVWFGNSNNFVVYGQKHKVWVLVFLVRTSRTFCDQNWADLVKFSVLQQNRIVYSNSMQEMLLRMSSNGLGNKTVISCLFVVPLGTVDDLLHYCTRPYLVQ